MLGIFTVVFQVHDPVRYFMISQISLRCYHTLYCLPNKVRAAAKLLPGGVGRPYEPTLRIIQLTSHHKLYNLCFEYEQYF